MKKNIILSAVIGLTVGSTLAVVFASTRSVSPIALTKAAEKTFTFDVSVGAAQFETNSNLVEKSVVTGVSSNLETTVSLKNSGTEETKVFGDKGYFVRNGATARYKFSINIGVNNPTSVSVTYGLVKTTSTTTTEVRGFIGAYAGDTLLDETASSGDAAINSDYTLTWTKKGSQETPADNIEIEVQALDGSVFWGEPLYIKSITLNWSC